MNSGGGLSRARARLLTLLLLAATLALGLAHLASLPPWEGFDETAHWSYIQELSDTGHAPVYGRDRLSKDIDSLYRGPMATRNMPDKQTDYGRFRDSHPSSLPGGPTRYREGDGGYNWQAQHPPLFYAIMVPLYRAVHGLTWAPHLLVLRSAAWLMAWSGWAIAVWATLARSRFENNECVPAFGPWTAPIMAVWPFAFGEFFADLARLGNDSLCLLIVGVLWAVLLPLVERRGPAPLAALCVALLLGAGLWTKAFFLPITFGVAALLAARAWRDRSTRAGVETAISVAAALAIGGFWYWTKLHQTGSLAGSDEDAHLARAGGLIHGLATHFAPGEVFRGFVVVALTVPWVGTWSLARPDEFLILGPDLLAAAALILYLRRLRRLELVAWAPLALVVPMAAGLLWHILVRIALDGSGLGTPGWYLHVVSPALGLMLALGWTQGPLMPVLLTYSVIYGLAAQALQLSLFSGCAGLDAKKHYTLSGQSCFIDPHMLAVLTTPVLSIAGLAIGLACLIAALWTVGPWRAGMRGSELTPLDQLPAV